MKLLRAYVKQCRKGIFLFVLFCALFCMTFFLCHLPIEAVLYPALLCAGIGLIALAVDYLRIRAKHREIENMKTMGVDRIAHMPESESIEETDYQALIQAMQEEMAAIETEDSRRFRDMIEYYTIWVHQIKTPIASMQLTLQKEDTPVSRKLSSDLFRIEQYVEMVLAFLRMDSVSTDYVFQEYSIDAMIRQAAAKFASEFIGRNIQFVFEPTRQTIVTDEKWFSFVLEQLLSNALKYTREGKIRVYMRQSKTLCIADTGIGIAPEDLPRIFEKGYTGYNGRSDKKASGLGLYLCRRICNNLGISLSVDAQLDQGTTVFMNLEQYPLKSE